MANDSSRRSAVGLERDHETRIRLLERRLGLVPTRLASIGEQVDDWDDVVGTGFYWSDATASNSAVAGLAAGIVTVADDHAVQTVVDPASDDTITWQRKWDGATWSAWRQTTGLQVGQEVLVPSSSSGTIGADGWVTFSSTSDFWMDGIPAGVGTYRMLLEVTSLSALASIFMRFRASGSAITSNDYTVTRDYGVTGSTFAPTSSAQQRIELAGGSGSSHYGEVTIYRAGEATATHSMSEVASRSSTGPIPGHGAGYLDLAQAVDGVSIVPASGTFTGRARLLALG